MSVSAVDLNIFGDAGIRGISNTYANMSADEFADLHGIYEKNLMTRFDGFNRYGLIYPDDELDNLISYAFIVRPDLNIVHFNGGASNTRTAMLSDTAQSDPTFNYFFSTENDKQILEMLSADYSSYHDFIPLLVGRTNTFPIQDYEIRNDAVGQLFSNYKYYIPGKADESTSGISFSIDFRDDKDLSVMKLFYIWAYYIHQVMNGQIYANDVYRRNKIADYYTSMYLITCGADGQEIKYYAKITGAIPTGVPLSDLSFNRSSGPDSTRTISFVAATIEHWNPMIIREFNYNAHVIKNIQSTATSSSVELGSSNQNIYYGSSIGKPISISSMKEAFEPHHDSALNSGKWITGSPMIVSNQEGKYFLQWIKYDRESGSLGTSSTSSSSAASFTAGGGSTRGGGAGRL